MNTLLLQPNEEGFSQAKTNLTLGRVVAIPTETVYGLAANALNPDAVAAIFAAKGRPMDNPLIVHIGDIQDWDYLVTHIPENAKKLAEAYWPGPLTIILPASDKVPKEVTGGLDTVAVRFPANLIAQAIILRSKLPLAAPSANLSGSPSPTNAARVMEDMNGRIAAVMDGGPCDFGVESTVIDMSRTPPRLLRPGGITPEMIEEVIGPIEIDPAVTHALQEGAVAASPGMKYKHYAPKAEIHIVKGTPAAYAEFVNKQKEEGVFALCFEEDSVEIPSITYGKREDPLSQAQQLFDALRQLDEQGAKTVYAACPNSTGVGLAVYNRLLRAAGFRVINTIKVVGLTGPTGAGKTTVANTWRLMGILVIDTDALARQVVEPGSSCLNALVTAFSSEILNEDGSLNRAALANKAFATPEGAATLNAITHPAILALTQQKLEEAADQGHTVAVVDAPLLFEAGFDAICHHVVAVTADRETRLARIMARDNLTEEVAKRRMNAQQPDDFYCRAGVSVIHNDGDQPTLIRNAQQWWTRWWCNK